MFLCDTLFVYIYIYINNIYLFYILYKKNSVTGGPRGGAALDGGARAGAGRHEAGGDGELQV